MKLTIYIVGLLLLLLTSCQQTEQETNDAIAIDSNTLIITDINGKSIRLTGAVNDSVRALFETNNIFESAGKWFIIRKKTTPTKEPIFPEGFEDDTTAYSKDYSEYGSYYYVIFASKSLKEKKQYLKSIDPDTEERIIGNYWDMSISLNEDKTKILEVWFY